MDMMKHSVMIQPNDADCDEADDERDELTNLFNQRFPQEPLPGRSQFWNLESKYHERDRK